VTCKAPIAQVLLEDLRATIAGATVQAVVDECQRAIAAIEEAKQLAATPTRQSRSDSERRILGT
jgi:hypothetical protein